jgi:hypothetical protein
MNRLIIFLIFALTAATAVSASTLIRSRSGSTHHGHNGNLLSVNASSNCTDAYCNYNGRCDDTNTKCICNERYITFNSINGTECNYKQKRALGTLLMEVFLGLEVGGGYLWLGHYALGVGQLLLFWIGLIPLYFIICGGVISSENRNGDFSAAFFCCFGCLYITGWVVGVLTWWIYAMVQMGNGTILDANGAPIAPL